MTLRFRSPKPEACSSVWIGQANDGDDCYAVCSGMIIFHGGYGPKAVKKTG